MADIVTKQELENASIDAKDLGECVHGNETGIVTPRLGDPYPTLPAAIAKIENKGGYIAVANLTELNAITPEFNHQVARTDDTGNEYRWDPNATPAAKWVPTGKNYLHDAKEYVDTSLAPEQTENLYSDVNNHNGFNINPADMKVRTGTNTSVNVTELEFGKTYQLKTDQPIDKSLVIVGTHVSGTIDTTKVLNKLTLADTADPLIKTFTMPAVHKFVFINVWWASASFDIRDDLVLANAGAEVRKVVKKIQGNDVYDADAQQKIKELQDTVVVDSDIETETISLYKPENERPGFYVNRSLAVITALPTSSLVVFPIEPGKTYLITSPAFLTNSCVGLKVDDSTVANAPLQIILLADHAASVKKFTVPVGSTAKFALFTTYLSTQNYDVRGNIIIQDIDNQAVVKKIMGASIVADLPENFEQRFENLESRVDVIEGIAPLIDLNQFVFYGQSLSLGGQGTPPISLSQPQQNLTLTGGSHPTGFTSLVPLFENNSESPCSGASNFASVLARQQNGVEHTIVSSTAGVSDAPLHTLIKGTAAYSNMINHIAAVGSLKGERSHSVKAFGWLQGEANLRDLIALDTYEEDLKKHFENMQNDAVTITGQAIKPKVFTYQLSTRIGLSDAVCKAQLNLCKQKLTAIATPTYHLDYVADGVHLTNVSYKWIGAYFGRAYKQWVIDNKHPDYLEPLSAELVGNKIVVKFNVPQGPLLFDTTTLAVTQDHGFAVKSGSSLLTINSLEAKENTVELTLASTPSLENLSVRYGLDYMAASKYIRDGKSGNLRDSTAETVIINGSEKPLFHVSPHFELKVNTVEI